MRNQFFIIGIQRCFTSWLEKVLTNCSEVNMAKATPPANEPKYFLKPNANQYEYESSLYESNALFYGEKSVSYIESSLAIDKILNIYPDCKIIICIRHPVQRTLSHFFYNKLNEIESRTLEDVFINNTPDPETTVVSMNPFSYLSRSQYSNYIPQFVQKHKNTYVAVAESLSTQGINDVCRFIGITPPNIINYKPINNSQWNNIPLEVTEVLRGQLDCEKQIIEDALNRKINEWA